jgi:hypothetical protein
MSEMKRLEFRGETVSQGCLKLLRIKSERSRFALVPERAIAPHDEQTVRPSSVLLLDAIIDPIDQCRNLYAEFADAGDCHILPLFRGRRVPENHALFDIALHLPDIAWVRLGNVHHVKRRLALVPLV